MIVSPDALRKETVSLIKEIDRQIGEIERHASQAGVQAYQLRDAHGNWALTPLLQAKATAYNTLVMLQPQK